MTSIDGKHIPTAAEVHAQPALAHSRRVGLERLEVEDRHTRRAAVLFEVAAVADRYQQDTAPESHGERLADILKAADQLTVEWSRGEAVMALRELAGRCVAWLEDDAREEQR
jgi:hypothetical protein